MAIAFLSILPVGVVGSAAIATSTSGRAWAATPRRSRWAFSSANLTPGPLKTTAARIFRPNRDADTFNPQAVRPELLLKHDFNSKARLNPSNPSR
ncbi:hypothetical protein A5679_02520 [Mycobacterium scrofulaceum]|uniref:Uncharacterized protein n=1 Tax=Mycobacterium scrofulaceum TaxID=1783 RepID=A0A1A2ULW6_MYCSC|nr:hypothetical protein A5679_02520 [Mycobacterium scrofulaceum]